MGVRETINERPRLVAGIAAGVVVIAFAFIAIRFSNAGPGETSHTRAFFTTDDGKTWFADDAAKIAPFQHGGKEAVRAYVFDCNGKKFVNHLERYTPEGRKSVEVALTANDADQPAAVAGQLRLSGAEVKRPGAAQWTPLGDLVKAGPILRPKCPDGAGEPKPVEP